MSGILKSIGKIFRKIKKFALPILAIGAIALTGGAALGLLPTMGSMVGSLGLGPILSGALTTAAQGATAGALTSAVTGGNVLKGATTGMLAGAAVGGIGAGLGGAASSAGNAAQVAGDMSPVTVGSQAQQAMNAIPASGMAAPASVAAPVAAGGGGLGGFLSRNPVLAGNMIQGIGGGLMAAQQAKAASKEDKRDRESYANYGGSGSYATISDPGYLAYDPSTGKIAKKAAS